MVYKVENERKILAKEDEKVGKKRKKIERENEVGHREGIDGKKRINGRRE